MGNYDSVRQISVLTLLLPLNRKNVCSWLQVSAHLYDKNLMYEQYSPKRDEMERKRNKLKIL